MYASFCSICSCGVMTVLCPCHLSRRPIGASAHKARSRTVRHAARYNPKILQYHREAPLIRGPASLAPEHCCTLITQCSLDRWPRFVQQAESWEGPVSVAVYIPAPRSSTAADAAIQSLQSCAASYCQQHSKHPFIVSALYANHYAREGKSALKHLGLHQQECPQDATTPGTVSYDELYPINALRNLALQQAETPLVLSVDSDFIISKGLQDTISSPDLLQTPGVDNPIQKQQHELDQQVRQQSQQQNDLLAEQQSQQRTHYTPQHPEQQSPIDPQQRHNTVDNQQHQLQLQQLEQQPVMLVLPAFQQSLQSELPDTHFAAVPRTKQQLAAALASGAVEPFHCGAFPPAYQPIDIAHWLQASEPYAVQYTEYFEPQGIAMKQQLPLYDERFRGYGLNKVQHAWYMNRLGYRFVVLPDSFMITSPHKRSPSWRPQPGTLHDTEHLGRIQAVYEQFKAELAQ